MLGGVIFALLPPVMLAHMGFKTFYTFTVINLFEVLFGSLHIAAHCGPRGCDETSGI